MKPEFDADEKELLNEARATLANVRAAAGPCPHPDLLAAVHAGVESAASGRVLQHLSVCPFCQQLTRDFSDYEYAGATEEEDRRIHARWENAPASRREPARRWVWSRLTLGLAAVAAVLVVIVLVSTMRQPEVSNIATTPPSEPGNPAAPTPPLSAKTRRAFVLSKAVIEIPAASLLVLRNADGTPSTFLDDLAASLEPYRKDDYAEAARQLALQAQKYPQSAEVHYYLGVSQLFLNENIAAISSLETARKTAHQTLRDDITWYFALALDRTGRIEDARREITPLCERPGEYQNKACEAAEELRAP